MGRFGNLRVRGSSRWWSLLFASLFLGPSCLWAQGLLVDVREDHDFRLPRPIIVVPSPRPHPHPEPPVSYRIRQLAVNVNLVDQIAKVQVSQSFVNTGSRQMEVAFVFPLPYDGAVDQLTFMVDGKEYEAQLLGADEARRIYESYVRRNQDPALMEWIGTGMFKTSIFPVPPGAERSVTLRYSQVCRTMSGLTEFVFPLSTAKYTSQPVEAVRLQVNIQSQAPIKNVYSPTHSVQVARPGNLQAQVEWTGSQLVPASDFRLLYDVGDQAVAASVLSYRPDSGDDGYFLLLVTPQLPTGASEIPRKAVVLAVDRSGSMAGKKMEQAQAALLHVLDNLRPGDLFNIVAYDSVVESFRAGLQTVTDETRQAARGFVAGLYAGGATNLDGALKAVLTQLTDRSLPSYVLFLSDGLPTTGETKVPQIVAQARERNRVRARLFAFGVGYDVNARLLDKLARENFGQTEYVRPDEAIDDRVSRLYQRIGSPVLTDARLEFDLEGLTVADGAAVNRVYPREVYDLFAGEQLVVVGRYRKPGAAKVTVRGQVADNSLTLDFPGQLVESSADESYAFIEKLWATRRVGEIIDQIDLHGKNQELVDELVQLSLQHGILTPYTSFLADDQQPLGGVAEHRARADEALNGLAQEAGREGFAQRLAKDSLRRAPLAAPSGAVTLLDAKQDRAVTVETVRNVGARTFFLRGGRWVDSRAADTPEAEITAVERYSPGYFELVTRHGPEVGRYLALEGQIVVKLDDRVYAF